MRIQRPTHRPGFTLVEMLVATALILFLMAIISQALAAGQRTFSTMRTAGQMSERLRAGINVARRDLGSNHFGSPHLHHGGPRLSDQRLDQPGWRPPPSGYFEIRQGTPAQGSIVEPAANPRLDGEGLWSTRATDHMIRFTVHLTPGPPGELFSALAPPFAPNPQMNEFPVGAPILYSRWAEVVYFLHAPVPPPQAADTGLPLYSLRRRIRLLAPKRGVNIGALQEANADQLIAQYPDLALGKFPVQTFPDPPPPGVVMLRFMGAEDVRDPTRRVPPIPITRGVGVNAVQTGEDILLTDVLSFEVKAAWIDNPFFQIDRNTGQPLRVGSSPRSRHMNDGNTDEPFDDLPVTVMNQSYFQQRVFDTWFPVVPAPGAEIDWDNPVLGSNVGPEAGLGFLEPTFPNPSVPTHNALPPVRICIRSLQLKLRIWDPRAAQARQVTIVQEP